MPPQGCVVVITTVSPCVTALTAAFAIPVSIVLLKGLPSSVYFCTTPAGLVTVRLLGSCATVITFSVGVAPARPPPPPPRPPPPPAPPEFGSRVSQYWAFGVGSLL